jgi:hypothetical protein
MSWVMKGSGFDDGDKIWNGTGWTNLDKRDDEPALFDTPEEAQTMADAMHLAYCNFSHERARETAARSLFTVLEYPDGTPYTPRPLIKNRFIFAREP